jgi:mannan endo-1,4-beta-mannosidase
LKLFSYFNEMTSLASLASLLGKQILGNTIYQDSNDRNWLKIDDVAVGESPCFSYKSLTSRDIGSILSSLFSDESVALIVYEWESGKAFLKTGLDINDARDSVHKRGVTTFIAKRAPTPPRAVPQPSPTQPAWKTGTNYSAGTAVSVNGIEYIADATHVSSGITAPGYQLWKSPNEIKDDAFVSASTAGGPSFQLNGKKFVPVGFNCYMLGLTEQFTYPTHPQITEIFAGAAKMSATVVRSHSLGITTGNRNSLRPFDNNLNEKAWEPIDFAFSQAKKFGVKLICPMIDVYNWYNGSYGDFTKTRGIPRDTFFTNLEVRKDFFDFISKWLNHVNMYTGIAIKNATELAFIELGNELGQYRPDSGSTAIPTQEWITNTTKYIKSIDKNHLVLNGSDETLGSHTSNDFKVTELDCHSSHFYEHDYNRISRDASRSLSAGKPYIIGEYSSQFGQDWFDKIESIPNMCGSVAWSMYPHEDGTPNSNRIPHTDGFTFWFDGKDAKNSRQVLLIANHCRKMQGMQPLNSF